MSIGKSLVPPPRDLPTRLECCHHCPPHHPVTACSPLQGHPSCLPAFPVPDKVQTSPSCLLLEPPGPYSPVYWKTGALLPCTSLAPPALGGELLVQRDDKDLVVPVTSLIAELHKRCFESSASWAAFICKKRKKIKVVCMAACIQSQLGPSFPIL